ncbi:hypothetical protein, conserved [Eimeria praecox]|uniref:Uncharacterized protein n=1 Tax=Eimeria praecox TaxID=51316 RepID=U6GZE6_9EIME|nr:hypothetical protein, conserved [Eimeria praecox]
MVLRQDQSSYPSRGFVGFGEHSFAELFIIRKEEDRDIIQPKSPKRENTPVDSSDDDTGFVAYGAMTYNDDDDEYSHGGLFDPVEASKISSYDVGSSNERQSIEESENSENEEGGDNVQDIDDEGDEDFLKQLWSTRELNGFIPSNLEKKVMKSFHSNYGGDRDRNETMNNTPSSEGVELEDANSWIRKDYRANIQQHVGISGNLSQHPIESCVPSDSEPSCYEMEAITASLRDLPPPPPESSVVENSGDIDETDSLVCDSECMDEECETDEDDDWYIIAEEANKTSPTEH